MKSLGWTIPRVGCCQRSRASTPGGAHVAQVEGGLVDQEELAVLERFAEVHFEFHVALDRVLHPGLEDHIAVLAVPLGPVHGDVGVAQELIGRCAIAHRDARCSRSR